MTFPKETAFNVMFRDLESATKWATNKRKFGGCFEQINGGFIVYWLPKNHPEIANFAW